MLSGCKRNMPDFLPATSIGPLFTAEAAGQPHPLTNSLGIFLPSTITSPHLTPAPPLSNTP